MDISIECTGTILFVEEGFVQEMETASAAEMARIKRLSLASDMEVVYDLTMFRLEWSPVFHYSSEDPVAWVHNRTAERRDGKDCPACT